MKRFLIILLALFAQATRAENPASAPLTPEERGQLIDRSKSLKSEADRIRTAALQKRKEADAACWKKTLVSACMQEARRENLDSMAEARKLDTEARRVERDVHSRDLAAKRARQAEEAPKRRAEMQQKIARGQARAVEQKQKRVEKAAEREQKAREDSARARMQESKRHEKLEARRKKEEKAERKAQEWLKKDRKRAEERARQLERAQQNNK